MGDGSSLLIFAVTAAVALCAVLAAFGFRGRAQVIGVDLGTTFSVVGLRDGKGARIVSDENGHVLLPSMVTFLPDGSVQVGHEARDLRHTATAQTIFNAKRFIGREVGDEALAEAVSTHPFRIVNRKGELSEAWFDVGAAGRPLAVSPEDVGARVVGKLLDIVAGDLGHRQVKQAVIAVPADFGARQRRATAEAFKRAGLKVVRILEEPTAAALAYGLHRKAGVHHILVYDFGGGTLDVSVLFVNDGSVEVIGSAGDGQLGGSDFDRCLAQPLVDRLVGEEPAAAVVQRSGPPCSLGGLASCEAHTMRATAEDAKVLLSSEATVTVRCAQERNGTTCVERALNVSRADFEGWCGKEFSRSVGPIERVLELTGLTAEDIDEVVMVGGTSRIPAIRNAVKRSLRKDRLNVEIDPDITVAMGAASVID